MPTPFATYQDVEARWRTLTDAEISVVESHIDDVSILIRRLVPTVDARITAGTLDAGLARLVTVRSVVNHMRNPEGFKSETDGDYSYTRDTASASGDLQVSESDLALLTPTARPQVGTIRIREPQWLRQSPKRRGW